MENGNGSGNENENGNIPLFRWAGCGKWIKWINAIETECEIAIAVAKLSR